MSYLRFSVLTHVDGNSNDYVFCSVGAEPDGPEYIEDYGGITDGGLVELIARQLIGNSYPGDAILNQHLVKRLAERLKIPLRKKPLTTEEMWKKDTGNKRKFDFTKPRIKLTAKQRKDFKNRLKKLAAATKIKKVED